MVGKGTYRTKEEKARIVMEVLSNSSTISEICRKYNVASSALYRWRDEFIAGGTAAMDHGRSTVEASLLKEINELKVIIGELTIANETLKKIQGVCGVYFILGDNDFIVILKAKGIEELNEIVNNFSSIENIERSNTFISMSTQFEDISRFILI